MSQADDLVICNQAKALQGMRDRLRSHGKKLSERQTLIDSQKVMIQRRDEVISHLRKTIDSNVLEIKKLQEQVPEGYQSELTRKCQELAEAREEIDKMDALVEFLSDLI